MNVSRNVPSANLGKFVRKAKKETVCSLQSAVSGVLHNGGLLVKKLSCGSVDVIFLCEVTENSVNLLPSVVCKQCSTKALKKLKSVIANGRNFL